MTEDEAKVLMNRAAYRAIEFLRRIRANKILERTSPTLEAEAQQIVTEFEHGYDERQKALLLGDSR